MMHITSLRKGAKMNKLGLTYIILCIQTCISAEAAEDSLKFAQVIFRHGARTVETSFGIYETSFSKFWPEGRGELTDVGKRQAYDLGRFLRKRYNGYLSTGYKPEDLSIWSSAKDRTIKSSLNCMLGLYKESNDAAAWSTLHAKSAYEPVPFKTIPLEMDMFLSLDAPCPRRDEFMNQLSGEFVTEFFTSYPEIIEFLYNNTGEAFLKDPLADTINTFRKMYPLLDTIYYLIDTNKTVEDWMLSDYMKEILPTLRAYQFHIFERRLSVPESLRLFAGPLVDLISQNFNFFNNGLMQHKMVAYSAHDKSLLFYMMTLGIYDVQLERLPPYASCLLIELHELPELEEPTIQFWYRNETSHEPYSLISPICGNPCTLSSLLNVTSEFVDINYELECKAKEDSLN